MLDIRSPWVLLALLASLAGNLALGNAWLSARDRASQAAGQRDDARADASACSDATEALRELADKRAAQAKVALAKAQAQAKPHQVRADEILATPASVPGDDCRSAIERGRAWLKSRAIAP